MARVRTDTVKLAQCMHDASTIPYRFRRPHLFHQSVSCNPPPTQLPASRSNRHFHTTSHALASNSQPHAAPKKFSIHRDRGPTSQESTVTDFAALNVLGGAAAPTTSVDVCTHDGFILDSGLRIGDGDGVLLVGAEAFVWRPWMAAVSSAGGNGARNVITGSALGRGSGGLVNRLGQWEVGDEAWGVLGPVWPRPDLIIVGTGPTIRPLSPATRGFLQRLGMRIEVLDTRNAASQFNLLATERGVQEIAAALVPIGFGLG